MARQLSCRAMSKIVTWVGHHNRNHNNELSQDFSYELINSLWNSPLVSNNLEYQVIWPDWSVDSMPRHINRQSGLIENLDLKEIRKYLTHWDLDKIAANFKITLLNAIFGRSASVISLIFIPKGPIDNKSVLMLVSFCHWTVWTWPWWVLGENLSFILNHVYFMPL